MVWLLFTEGYLFNFDIYFVWFIRLQAQSPVQPPVQLQNQPQIRPKCWPQVRPQVRPPIWPQVSPPIWPQVETEARPQTWRLTMRVHSSLNIHLVEREVNFITNSAQKNEVFHWGSLQQMWPNPQFPADLVTLTEEILYGKLHFLRSAI